MTSPPPDISRRALLGAVAFLPLAACSKREPSKPAAATVVADAPLSELEKRFDARLGVYAFHTGSKRTLAYRADDRFAFCSTFKGLAAAGVLHHNPMTHLDKVVTYTDADLMKSSVKTRERVTTGMTIRELCDAAVRYSDGTAGNLLLRELGGPAQLTAYVRSLGDAVTRMDRSEPEITTAIPGDPRDTTSPRAIGTDYRKLVLGDALSSDKRAFLRDLLERNTTGGQRIRAGLPKDWKVADKTGTGDYGTLNDIAIAWPPSSPPLVISIMSSKATRDAKYDQALLAEAAKCVADVLG